MCGDPERAEDIVGGVCLTCADDDHYPSAVHGMDGYDYAAGIDDEDQRTADLWRRKREAYTCHVAAMTETEARSLLVEVGLALDSLCGAYCGDPRDWGEYRRDAWTYGIVCGWGDDEAEDGLPLVESIGRRHGWGEANVSRLREYADAVERLTGRG